MDENGMKGLLSERLHIELQSFKDSMLRKEKEDIFGSSYKIEIYVNLYEIFKAHIEDLDAGTLRRLLNLPFGILEHVYQEWLTKEDSFYEELSAYAREELEILLAPGNPDCRKEGTDGTGTDQAA